MAAAHSNGRGAIKLVSFSQYESAQSDGFDRIAVMVLIYSQVDYSRDRSFMIHRTLILHKPKICGLNAYLIITQERILYSLRFLKTRANILCAEYKLVPLLFHL